MHARCDTDPLDFATDLCDECGGEFCDDHLVYPFGPKRPPLCKSCAIARSGVRKTAATHRKRSRSQMKRRRLELKTMRGERHTMGFEYFDAHDPVDGGETRVEPAAVAVAVAVAVEHPVDAVDTTPEPSGEHELADGPADEVPAERPGRRQPWRAALGRRHADEHPVDQEDDEDLGAVDAPVLRPDPTPARTSATVLLTRLRESGAVPAHLPAPPVPTGADPEVAMPSGWLRPAGAPASTGGGRAPHTPPAPVTTVDPAPPAAPAQPETPAGSGVSAPPSSAGPTLPPSDGAAAPVPPTVAVPPPPTAADAVPRPDPPPGPAARPLPPRSHGAPAGGFTATGLPSPVDHRPTPVPRPSWADDASDPAAPPAPAGAVVDEPWAAPAEPTPVVNRPSAPTAADEDDPWADVPPALRGTGPRPPGT